MQPDDKIGFKAPADPPGPRPSTWPKPILRLVQAAKAACTPQSNIQEPPPSNVQGSAPVTIADPSPQIPTPTPKPAQQPPSPAVPRDSLTRCPDGTWLYSTTPDPIGIECRLEAEDEVQARFLIAEALASLRLICEGSELLRISLLIDPSRITTPDRVAEEEKI